MPLQITADPVKLAPGVQRLLDHCIIVQLDVFLLERRHPVSFCNRFVSLDGSSPGGGNPNRQVHGPLKRHFLHCFLRRHPREFPVLQSLFPRLFRRSHLAGLLPDQVKLHSQQRHRFFVVHGRLCFFRDFGVGQNRKRLVHSGVHCVLDCF